MKISAVLCFRVHVWGACGRWFESSHPDKIECEVSALWQRLFCCHARRESVRMQRVRNEKVLRSGSHRIV